MIRRPPRATRTDTRFPYTTLFRSLSPRQVDCRDFIWTSGAATNALRLLQSCSDILLWPPAPLFPAHRATRNGQVQMSTRIHDEGLSGYRRGIGRAEIGDAEIGSASCRDRVCKYV